MIELIDELKSFRRDVAWLKRAVQALFDQQGITPIRKGTPIVHAEDLIQPGMFDSDEQLDGSSPICAPSVGRGTGDA